MHRLPLSALPLLCAGALVGCADDQRIAYSGEPGQATGLRLDGWVPWIDAVVDGGAPQPLLVDTGVPLTMLFREAFPELAAGRQSVALEAFHLRFPQLAPAVVPSGEAEPSCAGPAPAGLLGWDVFGDFELALDYRGRRAVLFDDRRGPRGEFAEDVEPAEVVTAELRGGGALRLAETDELVQLPATRLIVDAALEGATHAALVDTGSSLTVISDGLFEQLPAADRPSFCCVTVGMIDGPARARIARLRELRLGGAAVQNVPVVVLERDALFAALGAEIGRPLHLLVGGSFLRHFATALDYPRRALRLQRYRDASHTSADEYLLPGFSFCQAAAPHAGLRVLDVFENTDAARKGVRPGELLIAVDGADVRGRTAEQVAALFRAAGAGTTTSLRFAAAAGAVDREVAVLVEQMLPEQR
jgi:hypothetical protein